MKVVHIRPQLSEDELKRKQEEAARLFIRIYEEHFGRKLESPKDVPHKNL